MDKGIAELVEKMRKQSNAVYLATEQPVAADISRSLMLAASEIERLDEMSEHRRVRLVEALDGAVTFRHRPESDEWQADYGDHHAVGQTKERAILELGIYLVRRASTGDKT